MFNKSPKSPITILNQEEILTILGEDFECEGNIKCKSTARIEGKITGDIAVKKGIILGDKGIVKGNIDTETAIIFGTINGNVSVQGTFTANIIKMPNYTYPQANALIVSNGAVIYNSSIHKFQGYANGVWINLH